MGGQHQQGWLAICLSLPYLIHHLGCDTHFPICYALMFVGANIDSSTVVFSFFFECCFSPDEDQDAVTVAILMQESKSHFNSSVYSANETGLTYRFAG